MSRWKPYQTKPARRNRSKPEQACVPNSVVTHTHTQTDRKMTRQRFEFNFNNMTSPPVTTTTTTNEDDDWMYLVTLVIPSQLDLVQENDAVVLRFLRNISTVHHLHNFIDDHRFHVGMWLCQLCQQEPSFRCNLSLWVTQFIHHRGKQLLERPPTIMQMVSVRITNILLFLKLTASRSGLAVSSSASELRQKILKCC